MSSSSFPKINQKEYLKKYLSGTKTKKEKKHKKTSKDSVKVRIIDDDVSHLDAGPQIDEELLLTGEDAPQIVGEYVEEPPPDQKVLKWKSIVIKDEPGENENRSIRCYEENLWGRKTSEMRIKKEFSPGRSSPNPSSSRQRKSTSPRRSSKNDKSSAKNRDTNASPEFRRKIKTEQLSPLQKGCSSSRDAPSARRRRNSDQSPPRRKPDSSPTPNGRNSEQSTPKKQKNSMGKNNFQMPDNSPPRRRINSSHTPPKTNTHVSRSTDNSPPRRRKNFRQSPVQQRYNSSTDNSPPRRRKYSDQSPIRKHKSSDIRSARDHRRDCGQSTSRDRSPLQSPPKRRQYNDHSLKYQKSRNSDQSPPRRSRHSSDNSPPRTSKHRTETPDYSPPRKNRKVSDSTPPHRSRNSDQSPPRRKGKSSIEERLKQEKRTPDLSPPPARHSKWNKQESEKSQSPPPTHKPKPGKTLEGKQAGLQNAQALQKETKERRTKEDLLYETMSSGISGRNAEVQMRSTGRKGRRAREAADEDPEERRRKDEYEEKKKQQYDRWGKGLKQIEDHKNRMLQQEYESSKPLARYADDEDLERHLREQERAEDPMLEYMRQKRKEKEKQSGKPEIPRYNGPYPENRFGIRPGYRWDGVDRSNGYEKKYFAVQNEKQARQDEAYKYSVEDM